MPDPHRTTWFVIADGAKARVLARYGKAGPLEPVSNLCFAEGEARLATHEIGTERPGRVHESADVARHAMEPRVDWHRFAKQQFARVVANALEAAAVKNLYDALVVVAPPRALGDLRQALGRHARALVTGEVAKDLTNLSDHDLPAHLDRSAPSGRD